jgi:1-aminocyclopropane-1-carboxylate deaminase/D-cysteine desulfhydrase-like pyridoxal-dependent ACC family enzyme
VSVLFDVLPKLRGPVAWIALGELPTRVEQAPRVLAEAGRSGELWLKRDDLSSTVYGGNKLRLLEHLLGEARERGMQQVYSSGAVGSNFAIATALHAPRVGLRPGAICFPEPLTPEAELSHRLVVERAQVVQIPHWSLLPIAAERVRRRAERQGQRAQVLSQVTLSPQSLLGYLAAGLELAQQVAQKDCPVPTQIVLPIGSAATSAGILAGLSLARKIGIWRASPTLCAVRIAAWPLSRKARVLSLAEKLLRAVATLCGEASFALGQRELAPVSLITDQLGAGYPHPTPAGMSARAVFARGGYAILDDTYSAKAAAHVLTSTGANAGPVLFWCTKSSAPLPALAEAPTADLAPPAPDAG